MQRIISDTGWMSHTVTFQAEGGDNTLKFYVGLESTELWFDEVYLFKGNPDVYRRDFQNGSVFVNATPEAQTINTNGKFRRIKGRQDPVNDGSPVGSQLTLPAYDAAVLLRIP